MTDPQQLANAIGAALRDAEAKAATENATQTSAALTTLHQKLASGFAFLRDEVDDLNLDWDQVAGNQPRNPKGPQTQGGGPKEPPEPDNG